MVIKLLSDNNMQITYLILNAAGNKFEASELTVSKAWLSLALRNLFTDCRTLVKAKGNTNAERERERER